jgi:hypothetical protein
LFCASCCSPSWSSFAFSLRLKQWSVGAAVGVAHNRAFSHPPRASRVGC